jgi:nicotinate-nucleotide adenylyltransferase
VELLRRAKEVLGLDRVVVLVSAEPGHKHVATPASARLRMARAAFPDDEVVLDGHARTIDALREHPEWEGAVFLIGADEFGDFLTWKEPEEVLRRVRLAVATRPGFPRERLDGVLALLSQPERVSFFEIEPLPLASRDLRRRLEHGEDVTDQVPAAVADIIGRERLYRA